jgi:hypothetical protein
LPEKDYSDCSDDADSANETELGIVRHFSDLGETLQIGNFGGAKRSTFSQVSTREDANANGREVSPGTNSLILMKYLVFSLEITLPSFFPVFSALPCAESLLSWRFG